MFHVEDALNVKKVRDLWNTIIKKVSNVDNKRQWYLGQVEYSQTKQKMMEPLVSNEEK